MRPILSVVGASLRRHRSITHVSLAAAILAIALVASLQGASARPTPPVAVPVSILPENVAIGLPTTRAVQIDFAQPMDPDSVVDAIRVTPNASWRPLWTDGDTTLHLLPERRWETDARYVVTIGEGARAADGSALDAARQISFTTETAPVVSGFRLRYVVQSQADRVRAAAAAAAHEAVETDQLADQPASTSSDVSSSTRIAIGFSTAMDRGDVEARFRIAPAVPGSLSWEGNTLVFEPAERLEDGARYAVSVVGGQDRHGNRLGGNTSFSFTTRPGAQIVRVTPEDKAKDVTDEQAVLWFSAPMDAEATRAALRIEDTTTGRAIGGKSAWNEDRTQLRFTFDGALPLGHSFKISLADGARDEDQNPVTGAWTFATKEPPPPPVARSAPTTTTAPPPARPPGPPGPSDSIQFALWQINQSRAQYGFGPLVLDGAVSAVANAHAWDMLNYGYFSHTGRDGSRVADRLRRAGIGFSASGENLCYHAGLGLRSTLEWCHATFMAEPYPGHFNHIANILSPRFSRVGIGIAQAGGKIYVVWDFAG